MNQKAMFVSLVMALVLLSSCSHAYLKRKSMERVIDHQSRLIHAVQKERGEIADKVVKDQVLGTAENHLKEALRALKESNRVLKEALK